MQNLISFSDIIKLCVAKIKGGCLSILLGTRRFLLTFLPRGTKVGFERVPGSRFNNFIMKKLSFKLLK